MPQTLTIASVIEKNKLGSTVPWLIALEIQIRDSTDTTVQTLRIVRNNEAVTLNGQVYDPFPFDISYSSSRGELPSITIKAQDHSQTLQAYMQQYEGCVGSVVKMRVFNAAETTNAPDLEETFAVTSASASDYVVSWTLSINNPLMTRFPGRTQNRDRCSWRYKDPNTCGYIGSMPSCDLSLDGPNGCQAHSNQTRFGGWPTIVIQKL